MYSGQDIVDCNNTIIENVLKVLVQKVNMRLHEEGAKNTRKGNICPMLAADISSARHFQN